MSFLLGLPVFKGYVKFRGDIFGYCSFYLPVFFLPKTIQHLGKNMLQTYIHIYVYTLYTYL